MAFRLQHIVTFLLLAGIAVPLQAQQTVCYFGDSITEGWIDAERRPREAYPYIVDSTLRASGTIVRGIVSARGGESTEDALARFATEVQAHRPDVVVFAFGSNDYYVWGNPPAPRVSLERFRFNCRVMIEAFVRGGARVIVLPPPPPREERFYGYADSLLYLPYGGVSRLRDSYAAALRAVAREHACVDFLAEDSLLLGEADGMGFDGVHPSALGHRRIAATVSKAVSTALEFQCEGPVALDGIRMYPLPFNRLSFSVSSISFPVSSPGGHALHIRDMTGRVIRTFVYFAVTTGNAPFLWDGADESGTPVSAGAYILTVSAPARVYQPLSIIVQ